MKFLGRQALEATALTIWQIPSQLNPSQTMASSTGGSDDTGGGTVVVVVAAGLAVMVDAKTTIPARKGAKMCMADDWSQNEAED